MYQSPASWKSCVMNPTVLVCFHPYNKTVDKPFYVSVCSLKVYWTRIHNNISWRSLAQILGVYAISNYPWRKENTPSSALENTPTTAHYYLELSKWTAWFSQSGCLKYYRIPQTFVNWAKLQPWKTRWKISHLQVWPALVKLEKAPFKPSVLQSACK